MTTANQAEAIDFNLLEQYREILGQEGVEESVDTFEKLMPGYLEELQIMLAQQNEDEFRRQAHKIKGGCRSLGFARLGSVMQNLERNEWRWNEAERWLSDWCRWLGEDTDKVRAWLESESKSQKRQRIRCLLTI